MMCFYLVHSRHHISALWGFAVFIFISFSYLNELFVTKTGNTFLLPLKLQQHHRLITITQSKMDLSHFYLHTGKLIERFFFRTDILCHSRTSIRGIKDIVNYPFTIQVPISCPSQPACTIPGSSLSAMHASLI